jgi:hypothetical protein
LGMKRKDEIALQASRGLLDDLVLTE